MSDYSWQDKNNSDNQSADNHDSTNHVQDENNSTDSGQYEYGQYGNSPNSNMPGPYGNNGYQQDNPQNNQYHYDGSPNNYNYNGSDRRYQEPGSPGMATASLVLGICSIVFACCGLGFPLAGIGLVLAILSRGKGEMNNSAKIGLGLSVGGIILGIITTIMSILYFNQVLSHMDWDALSDYGYDYGYEYNIDDYDELEDFFREFS
ncbi:MAG TPA: hypothetical protein IAC62_07670 [Candidatus Pelethocola excrementipullorum]|nr:hypothetical protein [Candidatus Pelethocola excrementipullorum]